MVPPRVCLWFHDVSRSFTKFTSIVNPCQSLTYHVHINVLMMGSTCFNHEMFEFSFGAWPGRMMIIDDPSGLFPGAFTMIDTCNWLVVSNMAFIFHFIYGMSSETHWRTPSFFKMGTLHHQPGNIEYRINKDEVFHHHHPVREILRLAKFPQHWLKGKFTGERGLFWG